MDVVLPGETDAAVDLQRVVAYQAAGITASRLRHRYRQWQHRIILSRGP